MMMIFICCFTSVDILQFYFLQTLYTHNRVFAHQIFFVFLSNDTPSSVLPAIPLANYTAERIRSKINLCFNYILQQCEAIMNTVHL